ncbi:hypothetical protein M501DRAFT_937282 [Patellaria atrata CBS 101060]|uniref:P-loop containing nucleoside triphosphate hydrolase protein n=1 Tax=Patellaria atrata CBS 101060 TaxID=1346257 RepID=A0A9P4S7A5_9PEZI|nr:hypothetical protein M501DRAFT_937282 [Patellaria atrata CBS 101060]
MTDFSGPLNELGRGNKELIEAARKLEALGVEMSDIAVPSIVAVGDQSAGKSSLIEGISGVTVPRDTGTCTRCILHINTSTSDSDGHDSWVANVSLVKKYYYFNDQKSAQIHPLAPWVLRESPEITLFKAVQRPDELEDVLRRAQLAILNPRDPPTKYISAPVDPTNMQVDFSPNIVKVEIVHKGLPNLSLFDLPGVVNLMNGASKEHLPALVRALVTDTISQQNTLILLAMSMESDVENSNALPLIKSIEGAMARTIGVITKPDRLPTGKKPSKVWEEIMAGKAFNFGYKCFVTKQPSPEELEQEITHQEARAREQSFFDSWLPEYRRFSDRFGTTKLTAELSNMLAALMKESVPGMKMQLSLKLANIEEELVTLPDPPSATAVHTVKDTISQFAYDVRNGIEGIPSFQKDSQTPSFKHEWREQAQKFRKSLMNIRPKIMPRSAEESADLRDFEIKRRKASQAHVKHNPISIDSGSEYDEAPSTPRKPPVTPKKRKLNSGSVLDTPTLNSARIPQAPADIIYELDQIRGILRQFRSSDRPGEVDPAAIDHLISISLGEWDVPTMVFLDATMDGLLSHVEIAFNNSFSRWLGSDFAKKTRDISSTFLLKLVDEQRIIATRALLWERYKPLSMDEEGLEEQEKKELDSLRNSRAEKLHEFQLKMNDKAAEKFPAEEYYRKLLGKNDRQKWLDITDPFHREITAMSRVRGYYNVVCQSFVNTIVKCVQAELFEGLKKHLSDEITTKLELHGSDLQNRCVQLLAEDPERERRRIHLKKEKAQLLEAQKVLKNLDKVIPQHRGTFERTLVMSPAPGPSRFEASLNAYVEDEPM